MYALSEYGNLVYGDGYGFWDLKFSSDSGSVTENTAIALSASDSGAGTDVATRQAFNSLSDSGAGTDNYNIGYALPDTSSGVDAYSLVNAKTVSDDGFGIEFGNSVPGGTGSEFGSGMEAISSLVAIESADEVSIGIDDSVISQITDESSVGTDDSLLNSTYADSDDPDIEDVEVFIAAFSDSESPTIQEDRELVVSISQTQSVVVTELALINYAQVEDSFGSGSENSNLRVEIEYEYEEESIATEDQFTFIKSSDTGAGVENYDLSVQSADDDENWKGTDKYSVIYVIPSNDETATGEDDNRLRAKPLDSETGVGADELEYVANYRVDDVYHAVEAIPFVSRTISENVIVSEKTFLAVVASTDDSASFSDSQGVRVRWKLSDSGSAVDDYSWEVHVSSVLTTETGISVEKAKVARPIGERPPKYITGVNHTRQRIIA